MSDGSPRDRSILEDESALRWGFLEDDPDACAVVSDRMELVYMNGPARDLVSESWFGRRCFEIFPTANDLCAFHCPTMTAVHESAEVLYCEETLRAPGGRVRELGVAVIPLGGMSHDEARALLLLRPKADSRREALLEEASRLRELLAARFHSRPDGHGAG
ncbi:MAG TPA: PAS domain-containing protein [Vicinamibacteria bacterium]